MSNALCPHCGQEQPIHLVSCPVLIGGGALASGALGSQVAGSHYTDMKIQPVEYIHANNIPFIEGAVIKYVSRHRAKNGAQDIRKAIHFLELLLQLEYGER